MQSEDILSEPVVAIHPPHLLLVKFHALRAGYLWGWTRVKIIRKREDAVRGR
jgi:hypothetical protein